MKIRQIQLCSILIGVVGFVTGAGCAPAPQCPTIAPWRTGTTSMAQSVVLDPDVVRLFHNKSTLTPPTDIKWSPDGATIAMLERAVDASSPMRLWLIDVAQRRKRPLFLGDDFEVVAFRWMDATSLVVQGTKKVVLASIDKSGTSAQKELMPGSHTLSDITPSPDGKWLAYTRENNLYAYAIHEKLEIPLSHNNDANVCSGCVSWLYKEEFGTGNGFQWSNDSRQLWFRTVSQTEVKKTAVALSDAGSTEMIPYSHPGKNNPVVTLSVATLPQGISPDAAVSGETGPAVNVLQLPLKADNNTYLPESMWAPEGHSLFVTQLDRLQTHFVLVQCQLKDTPTCEAVYEQTDPRWVNYPGLPVFTPDGRQYAMRLEESDFAEVVLFDTATHEHHPLTRGNVPVRHIAHVSNSAVYFTAGMDDPLNVGIHQVSLATGIISPVSVTPGTHSPIFAPAQSANPLWFVDTFSKIDFSPAVILCDPQGAAQLRIDGNGEPDYRAPAEIINEFSTITASDDTVLHIHVTRPKVTGDSRYPALVYVYGGPHYQAVANRYNTTFTAWRDLMAKRGFVIFTLDNRGTTGRGRHFENAVHRNLTEAALADQLAGIRWLKAQPFVDGDRLGIMGWSFGGTMTLTALLKTEKLFRLGVAIAPVTDWRRYDSAYTERYMQRPEDNPDNYAALDLTRMTSNLTERLLLVHGTGDRNVLLENSEAFVTESVKNGRLVQTLFYPGEDHSIKDRDVRAHLFSAITRFIEQNL